MDSDGRIREHYISRPRLESRTPQGVSPEAFVSHLDKKGGETYGASTLRSSCVGIGALRQSNSGEEVA